MTESNGMGLTGTQYWVLTGMGILALVLVVVNLVVATRNADVRKEVNERQQYINQGVQLSRLHNQLVQGLATLAARAGDEGLRVLLARHGISFSVTGEGAEAASGQAALGATTAIQGGTTQ